jgi:hypothetical protein
MLEPLEHALAISILEVYKGRQGWGDVPEVDIMLEESGSC